MISKYANHCPLYRQSEILTRSGIGLDRATLVARGNGIGKTCWWLRPVCDHLMETVLQSSKIFADETTLPVPKPGNGKTIRAISDPSGGWIAARTVTFGVMRSMIA